MDDQRPTTYYIDVLGCKVNRYDAQQIEELLCEFGLLPGTVAAEADVIVVHTCGVTADAARKSRQTIRKMQRDNPLARVFVTGCAATEELTQVDQPPVARIPAGDDWLPRLATELERMDMPSSGPTGELKTDTFAISRFSDQTRAFLKVQDGCDIGCSFCIIPRLRKAPRDKAIADAVREAALLTEAGYREIVVTGISVGLYGRDSGSSLAEMLRSLTKVPGIGRIRLSSLHPGELTDELLDVWASTPAIMPHLHLSLQSGSDAVLQAMRRNYTTAEYYNAVERARAVLDNPAFTTDVIVGFPGESEAYFEESLTFCRKVGFSRMHVFTYSPRPKTLAAKMGRQVNGAVASERSEQLRLAGEEMTLTYHSQFMHRPINVLVESLKDGVAAGYSEHYIPVEFPAAENLEGQVVSVNAIQADCDKLLCSMCL